MWIGRPPNFNDKNLLRDSAIKAIKERKIIAMILKLLVYCKERKF